MALTLVIQESPSTANPVAGQSMTFVAAVTNAGATSVTLNSLSASSTSGSITIGQPDFLTPNMPVTQGNPTLLPSTTYFYPFRVVINGPNTAGPSPQAPGGSSGVGGGQYPTHNSFGISVTSLSSDGTVAYVATTTPALSSTEPYPIAQGGGLQLSSGFNLVNFLTSFA